MKPFATSFVLLALLASAAAAQSPAFPVDEHTVALYTFDGADPDTTFDVSGNGHHALNDGTTSVPGRHGDARLFDGVDDRIDMDAARVALQGTTALSLEYIAQSEDGVFVPQLQNHACSNGWSLRPVGSQVGFWLKTTGSGCSWFQYFAPTTPDTAWHYYALTWDGATLRTYRDGLLLDSNGATGVFSGGGGAFRAWIGHDDFDGSYFSGLADELRVSVVARSADEIRDTAIALGFLEPTSNEPGALPAAFALHAASPNPFGGRTTLRYDVAAAGHVHLAVYDLLGREVAVLVEGERAAGRYEAALVGARLAAGVYVVRMTAPGFAQTQRVTLVR